MPPKERRGLLDKFRNEVGCRVFLSTDAGGTGLNLQSADTVINLEVPWNPAVLEQRVARVHRLGQHRPVQVFHFVTRDSIEERVVRVVEQKRSLFQELFAGNRDELSLEATGKQGFMEMVRRLLAEPIEEPALPVPLPIPEANPQEVLVEAGLRFVEALANQPGILEVLGPQGRQRLRLACEKLAAIP